MNSDRPLPDVLEIEPANERRHTRPLAYVGCGRECKRPGNGTLMAQSSVPNKTALRKPFYKGHLRRAVFDERRGQDSWKSL